MVCLDRFFIPSLKFRYRCVRGTNKNVRGRRFPVHRHGGRRACVLAERRGRGMVRARGGRLRREVRARGGVRRGGERTRKVPRVVDGGQQQRARGWRRRVPARVASHLGVRRGRRRRARRRVRHRRRRSRLPRRPRRPAGEARKRPRGGRRGAARRAETVRVSGRRRRVRRRVRAPVRRARPPERREVRGDSSGTCCRRVSTGRRLVFPVLLRRRARNVSNGTRLVVVAKRFVFRGAAADAVVSAALLVVAARSSSPLCARGARAPRRSSPHERAEPATCRQAGPEPETARKTTAFLPGQIASAPAADRDGVVVRSNGDDRFCLFPERSSGALSLAIAVGRDGRDAAVGRDRVGGATSSRRVRAVSRDSRSRARRRSRRLSPTRRLERLEFGRRVRRVRRVRRRRRRARRGRAERARARRRARPGARTASCAEACGRERRGQATSSRTSKTPTPPRAPRRMAFPVSKNNARFGASSDNSSTRVAVKTLRDKRVSARGLRAVRSARSSVRSPCSPD